MSEWFGKGCELQCCKWEGNEESDGPEYKEAHPVLIFCHHKANTVGTEGNCTEALCPLKVDDEDMFATDDTTAIIQIGEMAENLAVGMGKEETLYEDHSLMKAANEAAKEQLNRALTEAGMESCKLECGLTPRTRVNKRIFKAGGVDDDSLFLWLRTPRVLISAATELLDKYLLTESISESMHKQIVNDLFAKIAGPTVTVGSIVWYASNPELEAELMAISSDLGDIIKETVHHGTLTSTMKEFEDQGNELPESVFQVSLRPTITMGGKAKYLAAKGGG